MNKLGMITIGQAPRNDVAPIIERYLEGRAELVQAGVLDGFTKEEIETRFSPETTDYVLTSRLTTGEQVIMAREKIQPVLQAKIEHFEELGIKQILLLCTGVFPGLTSKHSHLIEPDQIIPPAVKALVGDRRLGVVVPLPEQKDELGEKYLPYGLHPSFAVASPYQNDLEMYEKAANELKGKVDLILLDCMGYTEQSRELMSKATQLPVILSNTIMAKLVSEII